MNDESTLSNKLAEAERLLNMQKALLSLDIKLAKGSGAKLSAEDLKWVFLKVKEAAEKLAGDMSSTQSEATPQLSTEEIVILKSLAAKVLSKITQTPASNVTPAKAVVKTEVPKQQKTIITDKAVLEVAETYAGDSSELESYLGREATLTTLEAVPIAQRGKVESGSIVRVEKIRTEDGLLHVITPGGVRFNVDPQLLEFKN